MAGASVNSFWGRYRISFQITLTKVIMTPADLLLAAVLLSAPPGTPEIPPSADRFPAIQKAIYQTAEEWEILDPREESFTLNNVELYEVDLNLLRNRFVEFRDAPLLVDANKLPDSKLIAACLTFNREFRENINNRKVWEADRAGLFQYVISEAEKSYEVWNKANDAKCEYYYVTVRRDALRKLKNLLGEKDYQEMKIPPCVPEWVFRDK